ncbi:FG-GAP-like repeat-containing protein [Streptomyces sp. DT7]
MLATALSGLFVIPAQAASSIGGSISRSEVMIRGNDWVSRHVPYNQGSYASDMDRDKTYRQDCSGFVSMAWHLNTSENTDSLDRRALTSRIALGDLQAGDALDNDTNNGSTFDGAHVILFDHWINRSSGEFAYLAEAGTRYGTVTGSDYLDGGSDGNIAGHPAGGYFALRYNKITGTAHPTADVTGDGLADLLTQESDGGVTVGVNMGNGFTNYHRITGPNFEGYEGRMHFADVTGDGLADILTQESDGGVTVGVNMGNGFTNYHRITGPNFEGYEGRMHFADVTGDGLADILTQEPDGGVTVGVNMGNGFTNYHRITGPNFKDYEGRMHFA